MEKSMTTPADPTLILPLLLMVLPIVVVFLHDLHGCTRNCRQGRGCDCKEKTK
jgi:hypothetical protein